MNIKPVLIDPSYLVYQMHSGALAAAVYDRDVPLTPEGRDYASLSSLMDAEIEPGRFATCALAGVLRLGARPDGAVTADIAA